MRNLLNIPLLFVAMLLASCTMKSALSQKGDEAKVEIHRFDRLEVRYLCSGDFAALQQMNTDYANETRMLIEDVLHLGAVNETDIYAKMLNFYQDPTLQSLILDAEDQYTNISDLNRRLTVTFRTLKKMLPDMPIPKIYAQIGALNQSVIIGEGAIGISLDKYLGSDYPTYERYYSEEQRRSMTREYIVIDCITFYLFSLYPITDDTYLSRYEKDIHMAKVHWIANKVLGKKVFSGQYIDKVDRYISRNPNTTAAQLLDFGCSI